MERETASLRDRLDAVSARAGSKPGVPERSCATQQCDSNAALVGARCWAAHSACDGESFWSVETPFEQDCPEHAVARHAFQHPLALGEEDESIGVIVPAASLILDIETGGFAGFPVFLIGVVALDEWPSRVHQWLARDYPEETGILRRLAEFGAARDTWITFNGRSFDEPFLRDRAVANRVPLPAPRRHIDLLHVARRRWRGQFADCRLETLERYVLGRRRFGDVPGQDIPVLFGHFFRTGQAGPLRPVLEHNRRDLIACAELVLRLGRPVSHSEGDSTVENRVFGHESPAQPASQTLNLFE